MQQDADWLFDAGVPITILLQQICCSSIDHRLTGLLLLLLLVLPSLPNEILKHQMTCMAGVLRPNPSCFNCKYAVFRHKGCDVNLRTDFPPEINDCSPAGGERTGKNTTAQQHPGDHLSSLSGEPGTETFILY